MRAVICKEWGPPESLVVEDIAVPEPGKGQVRVAIHASSVNFPDVLIIQNKYQFKPELPFSPGSDLAGVVTAVGEGVTRFKVGDKVMGMTPCPRASTSPSRPVSRWSTAPPTTRCWTGAS